MCRLVGTRWVLRVLSGAEVMRGLVTMAPRRACWETLLKEDGAEEGVFLASPALWSVTLDARLKVECGRSLVYSSPASSRSKLSGE
jgi:hypothetical protein